MSATLAADPPASLDAIDAAGALAAALRASPEFVTLARAGDRLASDADAQAAIRAFDECRAALAAELTVGAVDAAQRAELDRLSTAMLGSKAVSRYLDAQAAFAAVCRDVAATVTGQIGIGFAANCRSGGCCG